MKVAKLILICVGALLLVLNLVFVPWLYICKHPQNMNVVRPAGYYYIFLPPSVPVTKKSKDYYYYDLNSRISRIELSAREFFEGYEKKFWSVSLACIIHKLVGQAALPVGLFWILACA